MFKKNLLKNIDKELHKKILSYFSVFILVVLYSGSVFYSMAQSSSTIQTDGLENPSGISASTKQTYADMRGGLENYAPIMSDVQCTKIQYDLKFGSRDWSMFGDVMLLQNFLYQNQYMQYPPTGLYAEFTKDGVVSYQQAKGLRTTGVADQMTRRSIAYDTCNQKQLNDYYNQNSNYYNSNNVRQVQTTYVNSVNTSQNTANPCGYSWGCMGSQWYTNSGTSAGTTSYYCSSNGVYYSSITDLNNNCIFTSAPASPSLSSSNISSSSFTISWSSVTNATGYQYAVYDGNGNVIQATTTTTGTSISPSGLSSSTNYVVRVSSYNSYGYSSQSSINVTTLSVTPSATSVTYTIQAEYVGSSWSWSSSTTDSNAYFSNVYKDSNYGTIEGDITCKQGQTFTVSGYAYTSSANDKMYFSVDSWNVSTSSNGFSDSGTATNNTIHVSLNPTSYDADSNVQGLGELQITCDLPIYTVTYNNNGGLGLPSVTQQTNLSYNSSVNTSLAGTLSFTGYTFAGWSTTTNGNNLITPGSTYVVTSDTTLYAVWYRNVVSGLQFSTSTNSLNSTSEYHLYIPSGTTFNLQGVVALSLNGYMTCYGSHIYTYCSDDSNTSFELDDAISGSTLSGGFSIAGDNVPTNSGTVGKSNNSNITSPSSGLVILKIISSGSTSHIASYSANAIVSY